MGNSRRKPRKALLVNPWIYDFAAYNFWIRPLGLYRVAEWLWEHGMEVTLIDCLSPFEAPGKFKRVPVETPGALKGIDRRFARYGIDEEEFLARLRHVGPFDMAFVTSVMSYWYPGVKRVIELIKSCRPDVKVVLGGIYATLWQEHARRVTGADMVLTGPIEHHGSILESGLGIPREGFREPRRWYRLGLHDRAKYGAIRTALGCPFRCTYCGSHRISGDYRPMDVEDVILELTYLHGLGVRQVAFYDDALLVDFEGRLKAILDGLDAKGVDLTFHTPNGLHARYVDEGVARYFKQFNFKTIRISLETTSRERQLVTGGKVTNDAVEEAVRRLLDAGIPRERIGIYLLCGLPGQTVEEIEEGIHFVKSLGVRPYLAEYSPIPGTRDWEELVSTGVISPDIDPLLTNNTVFSGLFSGITQADWQRLKALC